MAVVLRGGMLPQASGSPAAMRATRDLRRRRPPLRRQRAERLAPLHHTNSPYHRPEIGTPLADQANRDGVAARCPEPAVQQSIAVALTRLHHDDRLLTALAWARVQTAQAAKAPTV
jgi:hypothetical protein